MKKMNELMINAIFEVFEKMFYIFLEPRDGKGKKCELMASIHFDGIPPGEMEIHLTKGMAERMAQNMLSIEKREVEETFLMDCVKEALNMICGNFLRKVFPEHAFDLSLPMCIPQLASIDIAASHSENHALRFFFESDGEWVAINALLKEYSDTEDRWAPTR